MLVWRGEPTREPAPRANAVVAHPFPRHFGGGGCHRRARRLFNPKSISYPTPNPGTASNPNPNPDPESYHIPTPGPGTLVEVDASGAPAEAADERCWFEVPVVEVVAAEPSHARLLKQATSRLALIRILG